MARARVFHSKTHGGFLGGATNAGERYVTATLADLVRLMGGEA